MVRAGDEGRVISPVLELSVEKKIARKYLRGPLSSKVHAVLTEHKYLL